MRLQALLELLQRYWQVLKAAWAARAEMTTGERTAHERAFLPAALELQESPPHPAARLALWLLVAFLLIALVWACFGRIDVVAVAPGKLIVSARSKVVQPLEPGIIKSILVKEGQYVQAGQVLIELDATITGADSDKSFTAWLDAKLEALRAQALLAGIDGNQYPRLPVDPELPDNDAACRLKLSDTQRLALSQWQELQARLATIDADTARKQAEKAGIQEQVRKLEQTLPLVMERATDYKRLLRETVVSKHDFLEREQLRIETEQDLATQRRRLDELAEALNGNRRQREAAMAEFRRTQNDSLVRARERSQELAQEVIKAKRLYHQTRLTAPVSGYVQQLAVNTVGGVVTEAQPLLVVVPPEDTVEAEVMLENKDIGFVKAGQDAAVKIETFNYTKYGLIDGSVRTVSLDAIQDEKRGLIYAVRILLNQDSMRIEGRTVKLTPGMAVTAEIKTTQRRIMEYFLSPLIQHVSESLRER
ncbi:HlyD family type I secretion periplasmic adaptor subunit [Geobacter sp. SVR]|uniref:HlyD family type I secretion periplasmic adaptor subunit n=1 Tax=Geobacter sp. SVR TaxID=2495594 RepID=UPI00143F00A1|nr:HlyD family type I secretion periplasmic adaptor subunit [Geobacter sp. SVR]BCS53647.1 HlyD family type I secretion periplasmic adaptor subunit [Geobacter sp. SVR]GCF84156.1 HlyD family type I secretion periplasmic adaptor subunit [Geobacter sp. SVR]